MIYVRFLALAFLSLFVLIVMVLDSMEYFDRFWKIIRKWIVGK
jgi:hypothetical protein